MKFRVAYTFPFQNKRENASWFVEAANEREVLRTFSRANPEVVPEAIETLADYRFFDNCELTKPNKHPNSSLSRENPMFEEFFAFGGVVFKETVASHLNVKGENAWLIWNGRFDW